MSTKRYNPTTELTSGMKPAGSGYALMHASHIVCGENNEVLDWKLEQIAKGEGVPRPKEISSEAEMNAILASATIESVGEIYKYTGNTTDTYEQGALYVIAYEIPDGDKEVY